MAMTRTSRVEALLRGLDRIIRRMQEAELRPSANPHIPYDKADLIEDVRALVAVRAALAGPPTEPASELEPMCSAHQAEAWTASRLCPKCIAARSGSVSRGAPELCEKCDSRHADWLDTPYPHSIQNPLPTSREAGFKHKPDSDFTLGDELKAEFKDQRWVVGYMPIEENPWGVHGPMDDGRDHVYPVVWLSTRRQAECVAYTLNAFAGAASAVSRGAPEPSEAAIEAARVAAGTAVGTPEVLPSRRQTIAALRAGYAVDFGPAVSRGPAPTGTWARANAGEP